MSSSKAWLCQHCRRHLGLEPAEADDAPSCAVCFDLWTCHESLQQALSKSCQEYGGLGGNRFANATVTSQMQIVIPGDIALRYEACSAGRNATPFHKFRTRLKEHLRSILSDYIAEKGMKQELSSDKYPDHMDQEEAGHLGVHLLVAPTKAMARPTNWSPIPPGKRSERKRFRGNDPTEKQGGDPLVNQQQRLRKQQGCEIWTISQTETELGKDRVSIREWYTQVEDTKTPPIELHVVVYRRPFYVRALYTKARRDVSQTPFYVPDRDDAGKTVMKRLGITSVEEQIAPHLATACGGISKINNDCVQDDVVYGMIKFHASGREDMNVRMTLPPDPTPNVGGRPFVCEVIDALRIPSVSDLKNVVETVNQGTDAEVATRPPSDGRTYGSNPAGVGISNCLSFVPAEAFSNLQADTEEKVKYYGCHCWSETPILSSEYLNAKLLSNNLPIVLAQRTPIRTLHRRPNFVRTRHVLSLKATKIDDHYFRLNISTDAGTYVKEFVHGDLGRTIPSVKSLLGCNADILELDCEGIQQG